MNSKQSALAAALAAHYAAKETNRRARHRARRGQATKLFRRLLTKS